MTRPLPSAHPTDPRAADRDAEPANADPANTDPGPVLYGDVGKALAGAQPGAGPADAGGEATEEETGTGTAANRPAAVAPEYPAPTTTAARPGAAGGTAYDRFKQDLYKCTGTKYVLSLDFTDRQLLNGPTRGYNRGVARFDFGIDQDLWKNATLSLDARGGAGSGIDPLVPNGVNTNQFENPGAPIFLLRLAFYQRFFDNKLVLRLGKFDISDFMDYNRFGSYNFLAYSFAHNTTIPLPGNTLGAMFTVRPAPWLNLRGGFSNLDQTPTETGFNTFGNGHYLQLYEAAFVTRFFDRDGTYRFLGWYDNKPYPRLGGGGSDSATAGFALSFDQNLTQNFGIFTRYGYAVQRVFQPVQYWEAGFLWTGPLPSRPIDTFAVGVLQNRYGPGHRAVTPDSAGAETLLEAYYQYELNPYTSVVPSFQWVGSPDGTHRKAEFILGLHVNLHL